MGLFLSLSPEPKQPNKAQYGRQPYKDTLFSRFSYANRKITKEYLKCDIDPWKKIRSWRDPIKLDTLPTEFLEWDPNKPHKFYFILDNEKYERVFGYRELMLKRENAQYRRELYYDAISKISKPKKLSYLAIPRWMKIARGGTAAPEKKPPPAGAHPEHPPAGAHPEHPHPGHPHPDHAHPDLPHPDHPNPGHPHAHDHKGDLPKPKDQTQKGKDAEKAPKHHHKKGCCGSYFANLTPKKHHHKSHEPKTYKYRDDDAEWEQKSKLWKWPNHRKRPPHHHNHKYVVLLHRLYRLPKQSEERDNEWLFLSDTDSNEDAIKTFDKGLRPWMTEGLSFESQKLHRALAMFLAVCTASARSFLHTRNNYARSHIEYSSQIRNKLPFILTTLAMWAVLGLCVCSYFDIIGHDAFSPDLFSKVEKIELLKYWLPFALLFGNLFLVAVWSLVVLLGDGSLIAHYLNCWSVALHEMETSAALDIPKMICVNLNMFVMYTIVHVLLFIMDWPTSIRGTCGVTAMLVLRPSLPLVRISQPKMLFIYQCVGLAIQLYIIFSARLVMMLLQLFALMVKNVSDMWNFKFALTFKLLAVQNRGQLYQLQLNHSLGKLWMHHRLITVLVEEYGLVFCVGIFCYMIPQLMIFVWAVIRIMFYDVHYRREFYKDDNYIHVYSDNEPTINILYYNEYHEELLMAFLMMVHVSFDFIFTSATLAAATRAYMNGSEFVRRSGIMSSIKSHERKLLISLKWSFSARNAHTMTANRFISLDRYSLYKAFGVFFFIFTIFVRIQTKDNLLKVIFPLPHSCNADLGQTLVRGICTVTEEPNTPRPPALPPAKYYYFMDHCKEIEANHSSGLSFQYYSNPPGVRNADQDPFRICEVTLPKGETLSENLTGFGRYFIDFGNPSLQKTLEIYINQTYDHKKINYKNFEMATQHFHPDSTQGGYCGADDYGAVGKRCQWVEYYRDCMVMCYSQKFKRKFLLPVLLKEDAPGVFSLYNDYSVIDCGVNPYGLRWSISSLVNSTDTAYDCFGKVVDSAHFDMCGNLPFLTPTFPFSPAQGDPKKLYWGYNSQWEQPTMTFDAVTIPGADSNCTKKCYNSEIGIARCSDLSIVKDNCALSRYSGQSNGTGYMYIEQCFGLNMEVAHPPTRTGFCSSDVVSGAIQAGHAITDATYKKGKAKYWTKSYDITLEKAPCYDFDKTAPIERRLFYEHACIYQNRTPGPAPCTWGPGFFNMYRPYTFSCRSILTQIPFPYEVVGANHELCDFKHTTMILPPPWGERNYTVGSKVEIFDGFYGCHGKPLAYTKSNFKCIIPPINGVCEVDADLYWLLHQDCIHPEVTANYTLDKNRNGTCNATIDLSDPYFQNLAKKTIHISMFSALEWRWNVNAMTDPVRILHEPVDQNCHSRLKTNYCGKSSVALHYPYDGYDSSNERSWCNWEVYYRDCMQPYESIFGKKVSFVYIPIWVSQGSDTQIDITHQKMNDPLLNVFSMNPAKELYTCDARHFPADASGQVDEYWADQCGWLMTPEFVDGDPQSLAIMAPVLPIGQKVFDKLGNKVYSVLHCYESEFALYRCTHPDIFPICNASLRRWESSMENIDFCYKFNTDCFTKFNKLPIGSNRTVKAGNRTDYPPGFCKGYCPQVDTKKNGTLGESDIERWRHLEEMEFEKPPCLADSKPPIVANITKIRDIESQLFFQYHCTDPKQNHIVRDPNPYNISGSFYWPFYKTLRNTLKLVPMKALRVHLVSTFGPGCDYISTSNEVQVYPSAVTITEPGIKPYSIYKKDFMGCHGLSLVRFEDEYNSNINDMKNAGILDPRRDYHKACVGEMLGGWCEVNSQPYYFLREDFLMECKTNYTRCPEACKRTMGQYNTQSIPASSLTSDKDYPMFMLSSSKYFVPGSGRVPANILPNRRLKESEFKAIKEKWNLFKGNASTQTQYLKEYRELLNGPPEAHCFHKNFTTFQKYCTWALYVQQCYVPCTLVYPNKSVNTVSQSIVQGQESLLNTKKKEMYMQPLVFQKTQTGDIEPSFSFVDCVIDPMQLKKIDPKKKIDIYSCNHQPIVEFDHLGWGKVPEYIPDPDPDPAKQTKPPTYVLTYPEIIWTNYTLLTNYSDPDITYAKTRLAQHFEMFFAKMFLSTYFNCIRASVEPMRHAIIVANNSYWKAIPPNNMVMNTTTYSYHPEKPAVENQCYEAPTHVHLPYQSCEYWHVPSRVVRIYGWCKAIMPLGLIEGTFAAVSYIVHPPLGCVNESHGKIWNKTWPLWPNPRGYTLRSVEQHVYPSWKDRCMGCAYTRRDHNDSLIKTWTGEGDYNHRGDNDNVCNTRLPKNIKNHRPRGTAYNWTDYISTDIVAYKFRAEYVCWNRKAKAWRSYYRPHMYHPFGMKWDANLSTPYNDVSICQRFLPIQLNAIGCEYPCKNGDESEDCNSRCLHQNYTICETDHLAIKFNINESIAPIGLDHYAFFKENNRMCRIHFRGLNDKVQPNSIFGPQGRSLLICPTDDKWGERCIDAVKQGPYVQPDFYLKDTRNLRYSRIRVYDASFIQDRGTNARPVWDVGHSTNGKSSEKQMALFTEMRMFKHPHQYHTICNAYRKRNCNLIKTSYGYDSKLAPSCYTKTNDFEKIAQLYFENIDANPVSCAIFLHEKKDECHEDDISMQRYFFDSQGLALSSNRKWGYNKNEYHCLPNQLYRSRPSSISSFTRETMKQVLISLDKSTKNQFCWGNRKNHGFIGDWDNRARFLEGVSISYCLTNKCEYDPTKPKGKDTDYCSHMYDPKETFASLPICTFTG